MSQLAAALAYFLYALLVELLVSEIAQSRNWIGYRSVLATLKKYLPVALIVAGAAAFWNMDYGFEQLAVLFVVVTPTLLLIEYKFARRRISEQQRDTIKDEAK